MSIPRSPSPHKPKIQENKKPELAKLVHTLPFYSYTSFLCWIAVIMTFLTKSIV